MNKSGNYIHGKSLKKYKCKECGVSLNRRAYLQTHMLCQKCYFIYRKKNRKIYKCKDCKKQIPTSTAKRCAECSISYRIKNKQFPYVNGNCNPKYCITCKKQLKSHNQKTKYCMKCWGLSERGKNNPNFGADKTQIHKHHINLNNKDNNKNNTLFLTSSKHRKLHVIAYNYLVKTNQIKKYIKWFCKTYGLK
ncbi:hypothetical protein LCGC14_2031400 [marine sediment metagenome]|uniref:C2H2-type domain-containing protein n=1 Tax=marine sediment metagenome TaxID=412755 RepID=A0A0F9EUN7_9ZZZZ